MPGSYALMEELFARGDPAFTDEIRRVRDAARLGTFAARWLADKRPEARQFLIDYLARPLNTYGHDALVKRLFKGAEKAGDDDLMGAFLVALDRSIRHRRVKRRRMKWRQVDTREEADRLLREWSDQGYEPNPIYPSGRRFSCYASKEVETAALHASARLPQLNPKVRYLSEGYIERLEKRSKLFSLKTRRYLRRRCWRYFRNLGKADPARYRAAACVFLKRYEDADVDTDLHLLDNWGLVHCLFHDSQALEQTPDGWFFASGKGIQDLEPAVYFLKTWAADPAALLDLALRGNCRPVRQTALHLLKAHGAEWFKSRPIGALLDLIDHTDAEISGVGFDMLENHPDLGTVPVSAWLKRLESDDLDKLQRLSVLLAGHWTGDRLPLAETVQVACHRSWPVAKLGVGLLRNRVIHPADYAALLPLANAGCAAARPELTRWFEELFAEGRQMPADWLLEFFDSKYADVRSAAWDWLQRSPLKDDPVVWNKLIESPYEDVRKKLLADLTERTRGAGRGEVEMLWAALLVNVHGAGRCKPGVVKQVVERIAGHPDESERLLPLLAIAVRSLRGPEFRAGLAGVVHLVEKRADLRPAVAARFPELLLS